MHQWPPVVNFRQRSSKRPCLRHSNCSAQTSRFAIKSDSQENRRIVHRPGCNFGTRVIAFRVAAAAQGKLIYYSRSSFERGWGCCGALVIAARHKSSIFIDGRNNNNSTPAAGAKNHLSLQRSRFSSRRAPPRSNRELTTVRRTCRPETIVPFAQPRSGTGSKILPGKGTPPDDRMCVCYPRKWAVNLHPADGLLIWLAKISFEWLHSAAWLCLSHWAVDNLQNYTFLIPVFHRL